MKFLACMLDGVQALALETDSGFRGLSARDPRWPGNLDDLLKSGGDALEQAAEVLSSGELVDPEKVTCLPPFARPSKIVCIGLNYADHSAESGFEAPDYPAIFTRFPSSLIGHRTPIVRPAASGQLDFEGELAVIIGQRTRHVSPSDSLARVAGYSLFNDASLRDYQFRSNQWTPGKNFDATGAFGPYFVTADELPSGAAGLTLTTRLNGEVVQQASIDTMLFSVASLVSILSEFMTLEEGDVIVSGTPAGVGFARKPPLWMKPGDTCEVELPGLGVLVNSVDAEDPEQTRC